MIYCPYCKVMRDVEEIVLTTDPLYKMVDYLGVNITVARVGENTLNKCTTCKRKFIV